MFVDITYCHGSPPFLPILPQDSISHAPPRSLTCPAFAITLACQRFPHHMDLYIFTLCSSHLNCRFLNVIVNAVTCYSVMMKYILVI